MTQPSFAPVPEADQVLRWNLFLDDPMHGLPALPDDILPPAVRVK